MKTYTLTKVKQTLFVSIAAIAGAALVALTMVPQAHAATVVSNSDTNVGSSNLGELLVLDSLFSGGMTASGEGMLGLSGTSRLGELIVLSEIFDDGNNGIFNGNNNGSDLGSLIVLDSLFSGNVQASADGEAQSRLGTSRLGELIALTGIFGDDDTVTVIVEPGDTLSAIARNVAGDVTLVDEIAAMNGIANPNLIFVGQRLEVPVSDSGIFNGGSGLGELIVLEGLFRTGAEGEGTFGLGGTSRLGELIVLSEIFGDGDFDLNL